jgi:hypothetical protein
MLVRLQRLAKKMDAGFAGLHQSPRHYESFAPFTDIPISAQVKVEIEA